MTVFDVGSTIMNEQAAYEHRMRDIAELANVSFDGDPGSVWNRNRRNIAHENV